MSYFCYTYLKSAWSRLKGHLGALYVCVKESKQSLKSWSSARSFMLTIWWHQFCWLDTCGHLRGRRFRNKNTEFQSHCSTDCSDGLFVQKQGLEVHCRDSDEWRWSPADARLCWVSQSSHETNSKVSRSLKQLRSDCKPFYFCWQDQWWNVSQYIYWSTILMYSYFIDTFLLLFT